MRFQKARGQLPPPRLSSAAVQQASLLPLPSRPTPCHWTQTHPALTATTPRHPPNPNQCTAPPCAFRKHPAADGAAGPEDVGTPPARAGPHLLPEGQVPHDRRQRGPGQDTDGGCCAVLRCETIVRLPVAAWSACLLQREHTTICTRLFCCFEGCHAPDVSYVCFGLPSQSAWADETLSAAATYLLAIYVSESLTVRAARGARNGMRG